LNLSHTTVILDKRLSDLRAEFIKKGLRKKVVQATGTGFGTTLADLNATIKGWRRKKYSVIVPKLLDCCHLDSRPSLHLAQQL